MRKHNLPLFLFATFSFGGERMVMDQQAAMERLQELYREKNEHLEKFLEPVTPLSSTERSSPWAALNGRAILRMRRATGLR